MNDSTPDVMDTSPQPVVERGAYRHRGFTHNHGPTLATRRPFLAVALVGGVASKAMSIPGDLWCGRKASEFERGGIHRQALRVAHRRPQRNHGEQHENERITLFLFNTQLRRGRMPHARAP